MAEAIAVIGVTSSIVQLFEFITRLVDRLKEFGSALKDLPDSLNAVWIQLPLIADSLMKTQAQAAAGYLSPSTVSALEPLVEKCLQNTQRLYEILDRSLPKPDSSGWQRARQALSSLRDDSEVERIANQLRGQLDTLILHHVTLISSRLNQTDSSVTTSFTTSTTISRWLKRQYTLFPFPISFLAWYWLTLVRSSEEPLTPAPSVNIASNPIICRRPIPHDQNVRVRVRVHQPSAKSFFRTPFRSKWENDYSVYSVYPQAKQ